MLVAMFSVMKDRAVSMLVIDDEREVCVTMTMTVAMFVALLTTARGSGGGAGGTLRAWPGGQRQLSRH